MTIPVEERRFQALIEHSSEIIGLLDRQGTSTYVSPSITRCLGYQPGDLVGRSAFDVVHAEDRERLSRQFAEIVDRLGHSLTTKYRLRHADGSWRWIEGTWTNLMEDPELRAVVINCHDVTERVRAEEALGENQRALTALLGNLPGMVYRCRLDADWTMEFVSQGCIELTGYQPADLLDNRVVAYADLIHPDDREQVWEAVQASLQADRPFRLDYRIRTAGGQERWVWEQGAAVRGSDGAVLALEGFITDVTERVRADEALRENERLLEQKVEVRTRELSALYRADETLYRSLRLDDILDALVEEAADLLEAEKVTVLVWDASHEALVPGASRGFAAETLAQMKHAPGEGITGIVAQTGSPIAVEDVTRDSRVARHITDREQIRSLLHVPIMIADEVFGVFGINYCQPRGFNGDELRLLTALAQRAALAINNARLYERSEQRAREIEALYRADEALHASLKIDDVLQALVDVATDLLRADKTAVMVWDESHEHLIARAGRGFSQATLRRMVHGHGDGVTWLVAESGAAIVVNDVRADPRVARHLSDPEGIRSFLQVPISIAGEVFGVFGVNHCELHTFSADEQRVLVALAQRAALAIENASLYEQAQGKAALEERQKLARELHDSVSQALYGIALGARTARTLLDRDPTQVAEPLDYVLGLAEAGLAEMRALIFELRPESLAQEGLVAALEKLASSIKARHGLEVEFTASDEPDLRLADKEALFRVAQEALHNITKHAHATRVDLRLTCAADGIVLEIADDGVGFDSGRAFPGHLGLKSMPERMERIGGRFVLESQPGRGTRVKARIPLLADATLPVWTAISEA